MTPKQFIGDKAVYDKFGQKIWAIDKKGVQQMLCDLRGWGAIQNLFKLKDGSLDGNKADTFQDELGQFIADAINEKLNKL